MSAHADALGVAAQPRRAAARRGAGRLLRVLAGIDEEILDRVPSERPRYTALGGVVLGTAAIATFSMSTALREVLGHASLLALVPVAGWGLFVLNLDRWLVSSLTGTRWRNRLSVLLPRLAVAVIFGVIIAEPLVLRIFETAVEQRIRDDRQQALVSYESDLKACNGLLTAADNQSRARPPDCTTLRLVVDAPTPQSLQAQLAGLQQQERKLGNRIEQESRTLQRLNETARLECNGTPGRGLTGRFGVGPNCVRNRREADQFAREHDVDGAVRARADLVGSIKRVQGDLRSASTTHEQALRQAVLTKVQDRKDNQGAIGLLERFGALDRLVSENRFLWFNRWLLTLFFVVIDCLPVIVKLLGGTSYYERMVDNRLSGEEEAFTEETRTATTEKTAHMSVRRHQAEVDAAVERDRIDNERRVKLANMRIDLDAEVEALTERLLAQTRGRARPQEE